jgi:hypothetical protein
VIALSPEAEAHVDRLIARYEATERSAAAINLLNALERAKLRIARRSEAGLEAPRPLPHAETPWSALDTRGPLLDFLQFDEASSDLRRFLVYGRHPKPHLATTVAEQPVTGGGVDFPDAWAGQHVPGAVVGGYEHPILGVTLPGPAA